MSKKENITKMSELKATAEKNVKLYNEAIQGNKLDIVRKADEEISKAVNEYTAIARKVCFDECKLAEDPMLEAITRLTFPTIAVKDEKVGEEKIPVRSIVDKDKDIGLLKLNKYIEGGIGADKQWVYIAEKFNCLLTAQQAKDLGIDPKAINDSYAMSEISKSMELGKNPTSNTNLLKTLQLVINAMLGEGVKATSHDVRYLMSIYARKTSKALTVTCANHTKLVSYLAEICHRIVTGKSYTVEYKKAK